MNTGRRKRLVRSGGVGISNSTGSSIHRKVLRGVGNGYVVRGGADRARAELLHEKGREEEYGLLVHALQGIIQRPLQWTDLDLTIKATEPTSLL